MIGCRALCQLILSFSIALQAFGIADHQSGSSPTNPSSAVAISPGDSIHISVLGAPEFDREIRVGSSGQISLPSVGEVSVGGLSIESAQRLIEQRLTEAGMFVSPQVTLSIKEYASVGITVLGEVQKPGIYLLLGDHSVFDAISAAGGLTAKSGKYVTISHRDPNEKTETVAISNSADGTVSGNAPIRPGDTVVISKAGIVYVVGDVKQPTGIVLENPELTVLQAIAVAQGTNPTASLGNTRLLRKAPTGVEQIPVPLKKIMEAKAPDVKLQPDDVLFIPVSTAKSVTRRSFEAVLQTATGVVIYRR